MLVTIFPVAYGVENLISLRSRRRYFKGEERNSEDARALNKTNKKINRRLPRRINFGPYLGQPSWTQK